MNSVALRRSLAVIGAPEGKVYTSVASSPVLYTTATGNGACYPCY